MKKSLKKRSSFRRKSKRKSFKRKSPQRTYKSGIIGGNYEDGLPIINNPEFKYIGNKIRDLLDNPVSFWFIHPIREKFIESLQNKYGNIEFTSYDEMINCGENLKRKILEIMKHTFDFYDNLYFDKKLSKLNVNPKFIKDDSAPDAAMFFHSVLNFKLNKFDIANFCFGSCFNILDNKDLRSSLEKRFVPENLKIQIHAIQSSKIHRIVTTMEHELAHLFQVCEITSRPVKNIKKELKYYKELNKSHGELFWHIYECFTGHNWALIQFIKRGNYKDYKDAEDYLNNIRSEDYAEEFADALNTIETSYHDLNQEFKYNDTLLIKDK